MKTPLLLLLLLLSGTAMTTEQGDTLIFRTEIVCDVTNAKGQSIPTVTKVYKRTVRAWIDEESRYIFVYAYGKTEFEAIQWKHLMLSGETCSMWKNAGVSRDEAFP